MTPDRSNETRRTHTKGDTKTMTKARSSSFSAYPVTFDVDRPSKMSRAHVFLRILILILASWIIGNGGWVGLLYLGFPAAAAILIAQKSGKRYLTENGDRVTSVVAFIVGALAYLAILTDELPGAGRQPVRLAVLRSGSPTVGSALLRILKAIQALSCSPCSASSARSSG
jgi:hypothetical protein